MEETEKRDVASLVREIGRLWPLALRNRLKSLGVQPGQVTVLRCLLERDGWTQAELCRAAGVEQPTMANTLKRMERDGLVVRRKDARDRRKTLLFLAGRGAELGEQLDLAEQDLRETALMGLGREERDALRAGFEAMAANLRRDLREEVLVLLEVLPEEDKEPVAQSGVDG